MNQIKRRCARRSGRVSSASTSAALAIAVLIAATGYREAAAAEGGSAPVAAGELRQTFDLPQQPLTTAIASFERQTGITVTVAATALQSRDSMPVSGTYRPAEALRLLLGTAPLRVRVVRADAIALDPAVGTIGTALATGSAYGRTHAGLGKYTQSLIDTPQTIVEVPAQVIADQNATTLHDALRNVSGISLAAGEGGSQGDSLTIRGFDAKDDFYLDGMRDFGNYYRDPFNLDSVEVIMGPASMLLGHGEGGGIVNQVSKSPALADFFNFEITEGSANLNRLTFDENQQIGAHTAFRLNGMAETTNTADRDVTMSKRIGVAPSIAFGLNTPNRLTVSLFGQADDAIPDYGVPYINDRPADVPRSNFYGFADGDRLEDDIAIGTIAFEHDFSDTATLHDQFRVAYYEHSFGASNAVTPSPQPIPGTPAADITVARTQHSRNGDEAFFSNQTYVTQKAGASTFLYGFESTRETSHEISNTVTGLPSTNLLDPTPYQPFTFTSIAAKTNNNVTADTLAFFAADSIKLDQHFEFDAGLRFDTFAARNNELVSGTSAAQDVRKLSPQGALVYKPVANGSYYIGFDTSFQPSADALGLTSAQLVAPAMNQTVEAGTKWSFAGNRINATASIFNSLLEDAHITEPDGTVLPVGTERSNGFQLQVQGNIAPHWRITTGYTLLETSIISYTLPTQPASIIGSHIPNAPAGSANLWTEYEFSRWEAGVGANGDSQRQASVGVDTATLQPILVPGYIVANAMVKYRVSPKLALQLNAYNLLDKYFFDEIHPDHVVPGAGRSFSLSLIFGSRR